MGVLNMQLKKVHGYSDLSSVGDMVHLDFTYHRKRPWQKKNRHNLQGKFLVTHLRHHF